MSTDILALMLFFAFVGVAHWFVVENIYEDPEDWP